MKKTFEKHHNQINLSDRHSFEDIVSKYAQDVLRLAYLLLQDRDEAEDVLQESLLKLVKRISQNHFQNRNGSIRAFLLTCARNHCIDILRKRNRHVFLEDNESLMESTPDAGLNPLSRLKEKDLHQQLDWALSILSIKQRTILVLFEVHNDSYEDIALSLNITVESVRKNLYRTRKKLRAILESSRGER